MQFDRIGKYPILGKIGQGAMGQVFKARDPTLNRLVAIKTITPDLVYDPLFRKRFEREARSAALLNHPNIVTVYELGTEHGVIFLVMELLGGTDLKDLIARRALRTLEDRLRVVEQVCEGLAYAHDKGVIHRDLKPANIHVLPDRTVKIMDFGLAHVTTAEITSTGTLMGTPNYMSPEQVRAEPVDARSDVFSMGAVLYELLSGHKAFRSDSVHATLFEVLEREPEPLRLAPELGEILLPLVARALTKDRERRFQSALELRNALQDARGKIALVKKTDLAALEDHAASFVSPEAPTLARSSAESPAASGGSTEQGETRIEGATALDLSSQRDAPQASRAEVTLTNLGPATLPPGALPRWVRVLLGATVVASLIVATALWNHRREVEGRKHGEALRQDVVSNRVDLARAHLDTKDYDEATAQARRALELDPGNGDAREILGRVEESRLALDAAAREARAAMAGGDTDAASQALARVLAIDPRHPVVEELSTALNQYFRSRAEAAGELAERSRAEAAPKVASTPGFLAASELVKEAQGLARSGQFAEATQRFLEARDRFERSRRLALAARAEVARTTDGPPTQATARVEPPALPPSSSPETQPPTVPLGPAATLPSLPPPAPPTVVTSPESAIRRVIADYGRAVETRDVGLYRSVKPDLSAEEEKKLREAFKTLHTSQISIQVDSVEVVGDSATARITRRDTVDGAAMKPLQRTIRLVRRDGSWAIASIGQ